MVKQMVLGVGFEPTKGIARQIYSLMHLTALPPQHYPLMKRRTRKVNYSTGKSAETDNRYHEQPADERT